MPRLPALLLGVVISVASGTWLSPATPVASPPPPPAASSAPDPVGSRVDRLARRHRCSPEGLPAGVARRALLLEARAAGRPRVRVVSFERGWAAYEGRRPGTLVAVCAR